MMSFLPLPPPVPGLWIRAAAAVLFTAAAAYFDIFNKKWVPNSLLYGFAAVAVLANLVFYGPVSLHALLFGAAAFILAYPLYRMGQLGGADVFAFASIAALVPYFQSPLLVPAQQVQYPFILSVMVPTSIFFILHMLVRFIPYAYRKLMRGQLEITPAKAAGPALLAISFTVFLAVLLSLPVQLPPAYLALLSFLFAALIFFSFFKEDIKASMVQNVPISHLMEEDVIALEKMDKELARKLRLYPLIDAKEIAILKKSKVKSVPVYTGMPFFLPYLLAGLAVTLLFGDLLFYIIAF
jgi:Flp pilus assembly protein protease CpaA